MSLSRAGRDRWLLSYADLVTLLFACFSTAYAATSLEPAPAAAPAAESAVVREAPQTIAPEPPQVASVTETPVTPLRTMLAPVLSESLGEAQIEAVEDERGFVITLPESATFSSGSAELTDEARAFLARLADSLRSSNARIRVEGHTDDRPISTGRYGSNWELSTARASAVVVFLVTNAALAPDRLSAAGYGEFHPRAANDLPERRALNRRVDLVVIAAGTEDLPAGPVPVS